MTQKRGLGSNLKNLGLKELLSNVNNSSSANAEKNGFKKLPVEMLRPGKYQPRAEMKDESLQELAESIRAQGIIQPIIVRQIPSSTAGDCEIIAGERRWRAAQLAGIEQIPVIVRNLTDEQASAISLIENMQREDLNAIDAAFGLKRLIEEFGLTHQDAAKIIGKSRVSVTNLLRLLELNEEVKDLVKKGELEMGHARALLALDLGKQLQLAKMIVARGLSVRAAENLVTGLQNQQNAKTIEKEDPNILDLQNQLKHRFGAKVEIKHQTSGKGKLVVYYYSLDELEGILDKVRGNNE